MLIGKTQSSGSGPIEAIKNWAHNVADSFRHLKIELFGSAEDKTNLKTLDEFNTKIMDFHRETRKIENSLKDAVLKTDINSTSGLYSSIATLRGSLKAQKTAVRAIVIFDTSKNAFIARKRGEEIELIDNKLLQLDHLENQINQAFRSLR